MPFPKSHFQEVGLPVELSLKLTVTGGQPDVGVAEIPALSWAKVAVCESASKVNSSNCSLILRKVFIKVFNSIITGTRTATIYKLIFCYFILFRLIFFISAKQKICLLAPVARLARLEKTFSHPDTLYCLFGSFTQYIQIVFI